MNGAESLVHTLLRERRRHLLRQSRHERDAFRRGARPHPRHALRARPVRGRGDRRRRRLCAHGGQAGRDAAALRARASPTASPNLHNARRACVADRQHRRRPGDLSPPVRPAADRRHRGLGARRLGLGAHRVPVVDDVGADAAVAVQAARTSPGQIATLILPADTRVERGRPDRRAAAAAARAPQVAPDTVEAVARVLRGGEPALLLLGGAALRAGGSETAHRIAAATGCAAHGAKARTRRIAARARARAGRARAVFGRSGGAGALPVPRTWSWWGPASPMAFFAYPGKPGHLLPPDAEIHVLARPRTGRGGRARGSRRRIGCQACAAARESPPGGRAGNAGAGGRGPHGGRGAVPENAIVVDEAVSFGRGFFPSTHGARPHDWLQITGGAIGCGVPLATGAAIGAPGRRVVALQADGSAMYTLQGAVDPGAREVGRDHGDPVQPQIRDPARRARECRGQSRPHGARHDRSRATPIWIGAARQRHGRRGSAGRDAASSSPTCSRNRLPAAGRS